MGAQHRPNMIAEWGLIAQYALVEENFWYEIHEWDAPPSIWRFDTNSCVIIHGGHTYDVEYWQGEGCLYDLAEGLCLKFLRVR